MLAQSPFLLQLLTIMLVLQVGRNDGAAVCNSISKAAGIRRFRKLSHASKCLGSSEPTSGNFLLQVGGADLTNLTCITHEEKNKLEMAVNDIVTDARIHINPGPFNKPLAPFDWSYRRVCAANLSINFNPNRIPRLQAEVICASKSPDDDWKNELRKEYPLPHHFVTCKNETVNMQVYERIKCKNTSYAGIVFERKTEAFVVNCVPEIKSK